MLPCPAPDTCVALMIRHGATPNNVCKPVRLQGRGSDLPLSAEGRRQAEETGRYLAPACLHAIYSSPMIRSRETAEIIALPHALSVQPAPGLIEVDVGQWEGCAWDRIEADWPDDYRRFMDDPSLNAYLGGETFAQVQQRVLPAFEELLARHAGQVVAVVTHNVVNRVLLAPLLGVPLKLARGIHQDNCGVNIIQFRAGRMKLITLNSVLHLSEW